MYLSDGAVDRLASGLTRPALETTRYRDAERIGRGGMGEVYRAFDPTLDRWVALKVLHRDDSRDELHARLVREARILAQLEHPGIVPVHEVGTLADGRVYYAMKLIRGKRLDQHLPRLSSVADRLRIFLRIAEPVGFAHERQVLHRDLKPQNVMIGAFGEVLVLDWGVAKRVDQPTDDVTSGVIDGVTSNVPTDGVTTDGTVLGTPGYMAPEQARGHGLVDARADVYSLGALLGFLLTGRHPRSTSDPNDAEPVAAGPVAAGPVAASDDLPRQLVAILRMATRVEPADRYPTVAALTDDIRRHLDGLAVVALPEGVVDRGLRLVRRHAVAVVLILSYLIMRVALLAVAS